MSEYTELIAAARERVLPWPQELCVDMVRALEAAEKRITELEATLEAQATECQQHREKAWAERDAIAAELERLQRESDM